MKKIIIVLIFSSFLISCGTATSESFKVESNSINSESSIISNSLSDSQSLISSSVINSSATSSVTLSGTESKDTVVPEYYWNNEIKQQMINVLGEEIPYVIEFAQRYEYIVKMVDGSTTPYINVSIENASNWINIYKNALMVSYEFEDEDLDEGVTWFNYYKIISDDSKLYIRFAFYYNEGRNWFDIYAYLDNGGGGGLKIPEQPDYTFIPNMFGAPMDPYKTGQQNLSIFDLELAYVSVKCQTINKVNYIQFKKGEGRLFNTIAIAPIDVIYLEATNDLKNFKVLAGTSLSNLKEITTYNGVYGLNGATYFEIKSANVNVGTVYSIQIALQQK